MRPARRCRCRKARHDVNVLQFSAYAGRRQPFRLSLSKPAKYRHFDKLNANVFCSQRNQVSKALPHAR